MLSPDPLGGQPDTAGSGRRKAEPALELAPEAGSEILMAMAQSWNVAVL